MTTKPQKSAIGAAIVIAGIVATIVISNTRLPRAPSSPIAPSSVRPAAKVPSQTPNESERNAQTGPVAACIVMPGYFDSEAALERASSGCSIAWGERPMALLECGTDTTRIFARSLPGRTVMAVRCSLVTAVK